MKECPICLEEFEGPGKICKECQSDFDAGFLYGVPSQCVGGIPCYTYDTPYDESCGPFYHEQQKGGVLCGYYAINNMLGKHAVTAETRQQLKDVMLKKNGALIDWMTSKVTQAIEQWIFNSDTINFIKKDKLLYNPSLFLNQADVCQRDESGGSDIDLFTQLFLASFRLVDNGNSVEFNPMNVYFDKHSVPWNATNVTRMLIGSDYACTKQEIGHALAARKVNISCSDERMRGQWVIIDSQNNSQFVVNLAEKFESCLIATYNTKGFISKFTFKKKSIGISTPIQCMCFNCNIEPAQFKCGNNCNQVFYCGKQCA